VDRTETAVEAARISRGWMLFQVPVSRLKANDLSILSQSGGFVLMEDDGKPSLPSGEALSSQAREILASDNRARIGLTASPRLFRLLLNAGISVEDLTDMSQQNLRVYLRDWWADNQSE